MLKYECAVCRITNLFIYFPISHSAACITQAIILLQFYKKKVAFQHIEDDY